MPNFVQRLQEYVEVVRVAIDENILDSEYDNYIENFIERIIDVSEGEVVLEIPEVRNLEKRQNVIKARYRQINTLRSKHGSLVSIRNQIKDEIDKLKAYPHYEEINKYQKNLEELEAIASERQEISKNLIAQRSSLYEAKTELARLEAGLSGKKAAKKASLQAYYEEKAREVSQKEKQVRDLEMRDDELRKRTIALRVQNKTASAREAELERRLDALRILKVKIDSLEEKIEKFGDISSKKDALSAKIAQLNSEISKLEAENNVILQIDNFDPNNVSFYEMYLEQKDLLRTGERLEYKKSAVNNALAAKFIEAGKRAVRQEISRLENMAQVQYFANLAELKILTKERKSSQAKLDEIIAMGREVQTLQGQIEMLCRGKTPRQIQEEYLAVSYEKRTIFNIHAIGDREKKLSRLNEIISKNEEQFAKLENYEALKNSEYAQLINFIEVDNIF